MAGRAMQATAGACHYPVPKRKSYKGSKGLTDKIRFAFHRDCSGCLLGRVGRLGGGPGCVGEAA